MIPAVTVLLPVHNGMPWLVEALASVRAQTFGDVEVYAIDDRSDDGTTRLLMSHHDVGAVCMFRMTHRVGLTAALNHGLTYAHAPLIARLDADDLMRPDRLAKQVAFMDAHPDVGLLGSAWIEKAPDGGVIRLRTPPLDDAGLRAMLIRRNPFAHSSVMFRADLVRQVGGYDARYRVAQDYDLWMRLARVTRLACLPEVLTVRRILPTGVSATSVRARRWAETRIRLRAIARGQYPVSALRYVVRPLIGSALPPRIVKPRFIQEAA